MSTADPATELVTGTIKSDGIDDDHDAQWAYHEYEADDLYDFRDELRIALRADGVTWGFCALHRDGAGGVFTPAEQEFASTVSRAFAQ